MVPFKKSSPFLGFVWPPETISARIMERARCTGANVILEIDATDTAQAQTLRPVGARDIKISAAAFMDKAIDSFVEEANIRTLWVEYYPGLSSCGVQDFIRRLDEFKDRCRCIPISGDLDLLARIARMDRSPEGVALKGREASGFVGKESAGILFSIFKSMLEHRTKTPDLFIWGGIAAPEAAAAFLGSGARGVVFESVHWLTDQAGTGDRLKKRLVKLHPDHTSVVGQDLDICCRFFDKGNSQAVRELRQYAGSLGTKGITGERQEAFVQRILNESRRALESNLSRKELIPLGPEAAFARSFAERFGKSTEQAFKAFMEAVEGILDESSKRVGRFFEGPITEGLGSRYPFIQGAMSWITDVPEFALAVAEAGGLPTLAFGLNPPSELEKRFGRLKDILGDHPYAVNLIALPENPYLDDHLKWIERNRPPFAVIAAGDTALASRLLKEGIEVIYVAPEEGLLRMALEAGVRYLVLEGMESGGHIGSHSTLTLAQIALELKTEVPNLFKDRFVVLAGGIFNGDTVFRAAMLGADGVQLGTAYLATKEIVDTGALSPLYQKMILKSGPGETAVSGESIGLRVRGLMTPKMETVQELERKFTAGDEEEASFRKRMETIAAGSLLVAARGVEEPGGRTLEEERCLKEGQFMSGAAAGAIDRVQTVAELHRDLVNSAWSPADSKRGEKTSFAGSRMQEGSRGAPERIAITGMAVVNSLGNTPEEVWEQVLAMKSGIVDVLPDKVDIREFYDPNPQKPGKTYCKVGAFSNIGISRKELGISPHDFRTMAESTKLTMWLAQKAINDSGVLDSEIHRERIGVIVSQNSGEAASTVRDLSMEVSAYDVLSALRNTVSISDEQESALLKELKSGLITVDDTTLLGRLNCAASGFICNKYGFMGPSHSVSAACATSLVALYTAIQMIKNGVLDAAVIGGGEETLKPSHFLEFSALGALAGLSGLERRPQEYSRPFDAERDGMVLGEGGGMIVIERESMARARGAFIHALITGIGASNNHRGMVESLAETQEIAVKASFENTPYGPEQVDFVECHATGTIQGDLEEVKALRSIFPLGKSTVLASFKSQIGHTLGASGLNSLIRGVTAMQSGIYPPTLNYQTPDPGIGLESSGFRVPIAPEEWHQPKEGPRRFMVNSFGFGGANYVVQLEESCDRKRKSTAPFCFEQTGGPEGGKEEIGSVEQIEGVSFFKTTIAGEPYRLGVVADSLRAARDKVAALDPGLPPEEWSPKYLRNLEHRGIFAASSQGKASEIALVFAGQGAQYAGMGKELYEKFSVVRKWMDKVAETADFDLLDLLFHSREEDLQKTRWQQPAMFTMEYAMARHLTSLGVRPRAMAGHSLGELVALSIAGVFSVEDGFRLVNKRAQCMDKAAGLHVDPGTMIAVDAPFEFLEKDISGIEGVYFTNFNSPRQTVLGGGTEEINALMERLWKEGYRATQLNVSMAFHSPIMEVIHEEMEDFLKGITFYPPRIPVISNTTMEPFPQDVEKIKKIVMDHLESPVHWMQNVRTLWEDYKTRLFVEIGPRSTLCNLISDTIEEAQCFPTCDPEGEAGTYRAVLARLYSLGHLQPPGQAGHIPFPEPVKSPPALDRVQAIVQREINSFVLESFGKFLKPQIIEAIQKEVSPDFGVEDLDRIIKGEPGNLTQSLASEGKRPASPGDGNKGVRQASPPEEAPAEGGESPLPEEGDYLEKVIRIIMDATGYERDEIEPEMNIRQDLAIRSSRLPVIVDAAERRFGISISIEDFIDVRTVKDLGDRVTQLVHQSGAEISETEAQPGEGFAPYKEPQVGDLDHEADHDSPFEREGIRRFVFKEHPLEEKTPGEIEIKPNQQVAVLNLAPNTELADEVARIFKKEFHERPSRLDVLDRGRGRKGYNLRRWEDGQLLSQYLGGLESLSGLVFVLDRETDSAFSASEEIPIILTGLFNCFQAFMRSPAKEFCFVLCRGLSGESIEAVTGEGILGMLMGGAHEYTSVVFRSIEIDRETDLERALRRGLDARNSWIQLIYRGQDAFTLQARPRPLNIGCQVPLKLDPGDVIVVSGGAKGISRHLARALRPLGPRLIFLGRSGARDVPFEGLFSTERGAARDIRPSEFGGKRPLSIRRNSGESPCGPAGSSGIFGALEDFSNREMDAAYYSCDVTDSERVQEVMSRIVERYGKIDGIIHGAGVLRDSFVGFMTPEDFAEVVKTKLLGAWNLYQSAKDHGLRFMAGLSSLAAVLGNAGQANYCAANRSMSALMRYFSKDRKYFSAKAFMLPPIEGAGMADDPEVKELIRLRGMGESYVHVSELAEFFCQEIFLGQPGSPWVMAARSLPEVNTARVDWDGEEQGEEGTTDSWFRFEHKDFPMIDRITKVDSGKGELEASRTFSPDRDLWINDHRPFAFLKNPIVSAIMGLETLMEAARLLYPYLNIAGVNNLGFEDILECPPGVNRETRVLCRRLQGDPGEVICGVSLLSRDISPKGRSLERWSSSFHGEIVMGAQAGFLKSREDYLVRQEELVPPSLDRNEVLRWYEEGTALKDRYRVIESVDGVGAGMIKGGMVYREYGDFSGLGQAYYQYSPYVLEGLLHLMVMYVVLAEDGGSAPLLPKLIGEIRTGRQCQPGERVELAARMRSKDSDGFLWDAVSMDEEGAVLMQVRNVHMKVIGE